MVTLAPLLLTTLAVSASSCARRGGDPPPPDSEREARRDVDEPRPIEMVLADSTAAWMEIAGVEGTGLGRCEGRPCIVVYVARRTEEIDRRIPEAVAGHPVRVEVTGVFEPRRPGGPS